MQVAYPRCWGLDVHKKFIVACLLVRDERGHGRKEVQSFGTTTGEILRLTDWLSGLGATQVAMESSGVYWQPVFTLREDAFTLLVVNAQHIRQVPGRKTDVRLRHEVVSVAVETEQSGCNRVFCHQYPTAACGRSNPTVRSRRDNVASPPRWPSACKGRR